MLIRGQHLNLRTSAEIYILYLTASWLLTRWKLVLLLALSALIIHVQILWSHHILIFSEETFRTVEESLKKKTSSYRQGVDNSKLFPNKEYLYYIFTIIYFFFKSTFLATIRSKSTCDVIFDQRETGQCLDDTRSVMRGSRSRLPWTFKLMTFPYM